MTEHQAGVVELPRRVVEFELKRPKVNLPQVDVEPVRRVAKDVLLTGIGIAVLTGRAVVRAIKAANAAGVEVAEHPGPVTKALLGLVRAPEQASAAPQSFSVLPIADYDTRPVTEIVALLPELDQAEIEALLAYEREHQARVVLIAALTAPRA